MIQVRDDIILHRGGDLVAVATWGQTVNGVWTPIDLSGQTFTPFEVSPAALATGMTIVVTDGPNGEMTITRAWDADWPDGLGSLVTFRAVSASGLYTLPMIKVVLK